MKTSRRQFLSQTGFVTAGFVGLERFLRSPVCAAQAYQSEIEKYGKLVDDPQRILDLPKGFSYKVMSVTGESMTDGLRTPGRPDGMAAFSGPNGRVVLVRNHELDDDQTFGSPFGITNAWLSKVDQSKVFDKGGGVRPQIGGTTNVVFNPEKREVERSFLSLAGTARNCAGGPTPWGTWITCEETVIRKREEKKADKKRRRGAKAKKRAARRKKEKKEDKPDPWAHLEHAHGYNFEVPATHEVGLCEPIPLKAMGRFNHEAVAVDPASGIVYQTEDRDDGLITRFIPKEPGNLKAGGILQGLAVKGQESCDTRNWPDTGKPKLAVNDPLEVEWMTLEEIDNPEDKLREDAYKAGCARFARGEGMWYDNKKVYFACTNGGIAKSGQIFIYRPSPFEGTSEEKKQPATLTLYLEPNNTHLLQYGDNLTVAPWGDLVICEDGAEQQFLRGITPAGKIYTIAMSRYVGDSEICGCCFAPNHPILFLNLQNPGITLAITGPWETLRAT